MGADYGRLASDVIVALKELMNAQDLIAGQNIGEPGIETAFDPYDRVGGQIVRDATSSHVITGYEPSDVYSGVRLVEQRL